MTDTAPIGSPASSLFRYKLSGPSEITMDLGQFKNTNEHIKIIKNCNIYAILIYYHQASDRLKKNQYNS